MLKGHIWVCDVCKQEIINDGFPKAWYQVEIRTGDYFRSDEGGQVLNKDCCSEKCLKATLRTYLEVE